MQKNDEKSEAGHSTTDLHGETKDILDQIEAKVEQLKPILTQEGVAILREIEDLYCLYAGEVGRLMASNATPVDKLFFK